MTRPLTADEVLDERVNRLREVALANFCQGMTNLEDRTAARRSCTEVGRIVYADLLWVAFDVDSTLYVFRHGPNDEGMEVRYL